MMRTAKVSIDSKVWVLMPAQRRSYDDKEQLGESHREFVEEGSEAVK